MQQGFVYPKNLIPSYSCPLCGSGRMSPNIENSLSRKTGESVSLGKMDYWEESFHKEILRIDIACTNDECKEVGVLVMKGELYAPDENQPEAEILYSPIYINPSPLLFPQDDVIPEAISKLMKEAFLLFWLILPLVETKRGLLLKHYLMTRM